jgi:hypothetical protein
MDRAGYEPPAQVIFTVCHMRATASGISRRLAEFGLGPGGYSVGQRLLTLAGGMQVDQRGVAGGVAHAFHQLTKIRPGLGDQTVARMAQVMKMDIYPRCGHGREPDPAAEVAMPQRLACRAREQQRVRITLWQMNRVPVGQAGSLRWTQSLDGLRLTGGYLPAPDEAIARDSR